MSPSWKIIGILDGDVPGVEDLLCFFGLEVPKVASIEVSTV